MATAAASRKLYDWRTPGWDCNGKGRRREEVIYCATHAKVPDVGPQLKCHHYHGTRDDAQAHFLAQGEEDFQAWLRGESPYIVVPCVLGTGIVVPGITHAIRVDAPHSIIVNAQEDGRVGRAEAREAAIIVEEKDWLGRPRARRARLLSS